LLTGAPVRSTPEPGPALLSLYAGLAAPEAAVLDALVRLGETTAATLAARVGTSPESAARALDRLVALAYAVRVDAAAGADGEASFRATARGHPG